MPVGPGGINNTLVTLRPNGIYPSGFAWTPADSTSAGIVGDDNDATSLLQNVPGFTASSFTMPVFTIPSFAQIRFLQARARGFSNLLGIDGDDSVRFVFLRVLPNPGVPGADTTPGAVRTAVAFTTDTATLAAPAWSSQEDGSPFDQGFFNALLMETAVTLQAPGSTVNLVELYLDVWFNQAPIVVPTGPAGTITASSRPSLSHTFTDAEGDAQDRYQRKVYARPVSGVWPTGLDPSTGLYTGSTTPLIPVVDLGTNFGTQLADPMPVSLQNGVYRHYVRAADANSGGRFGAWAFTEWTQSVPAPAAPTVAVSPNTTTQRTNVTLTPNNSSPATTYFILQRSDDGGVTWTNVVNGARIPTQ